MELSFIMPPMLSWFSDIVWSIVQIILIVGAIYIVSALLSSINILMAIIEIAAAIAYVVVVNGLRDKWTAGADIFGINPESFQTFTIPALLITTMFYGSLGEGFFTVFINPNVWVLSYVEENWGIISDEGFTLHFAPEESGGFLSNVAISFIIGYFFTKYLAVPYSSWCVWIFPTYFLINGAIHLIYMFPIPFRLNALYTALVNWVPTIAVIIASIVNSNSEGRRPYNSQGSAGSDDPSSDSGQSIAMEKNRDILLQYMWDAYPDWENESYRLWGTFGEEERFMYIYRDADMDVAAGYTRSEEDEWTYALTHYSCLKNGEPVSYLYDAETETKTKENVDNSSYAPGFLYGSLGELAGGYFDYFLLDEETFLNGEFRGLGGDEGSVVSFDWLTWSSDGNFVYHLHYVVDAEIYDEDGNMEYISFRSSSVSIGPMKDGLYSYGIRLSENELDNPLSPYIRYPGS